MTAMLCSMMTEKHITIDRVALLLLFFIVSLHGETCEDYKQPKLNTSCSLLTETVECLVDLQDQGCGTGFAMVKFANCDTIALPCCVPCGRQLILNDSCTTDYCVQGRLAQGTRYRKSKSCHYRAGSWSACHSDLLIKRRVDMLASSGTAQSCHPRNVIEKVCDPKDVGPRSANAFPSHPYSSDSSWSQNTSFKVNHQVDASAMPAKSQRHAQRSDSMMSDDEVTTRHISSYIEDNDVSDIDCVYKSAAPWSSCDPVTEKRTLLRVIDPKSSIHCPHNMTETRPCFTKSGKERCFYSKWSRWSRCENFIQRRQRELLYGNRNDCQRRHKIRTCQPKVKPPHRDRRHRESLFTL